MRILLIEDEPGIRDFLERGLTSAGYEVEVAAEGAVAVTKCFNSEFSLIILDLMLPDMDGLEVLQRIRHRKGSPPVLIVSAREALDDRVNGLEQGADDYLVKPFAFVELLARVRALLRRGQPAADRAEVGGLVMDFNRRRAVLSGEVLELAPKEYGILELLMRNHGKPLTRNMIVENVWDVEYDGLTNIVDVYIRHLRTKIDEKVGVKMIHTVRGVGYMIDAGGESLAG
jgi:DNA-binding response OmpR family regulator